MKDVGLELDETGGLNAEGRMRLEELKKKLQGIGDRTYQSLSEGVANVASEFYTQEEMLQFNKPKNKKKKIRKKKDALDLDALEADAEAEGLGDADHGSRAHVLERQAAAKLEKERAEEESRRSAYLSAYAKAVDASSKLRAAGSKQETREDDDDVRGSVFGGEEDDELERVLQRARQAALKKQVSSESNGAGVGPQAVAAALAGKVDMVEGGDKAAESVDKASSNSVVITDVEEFCRSLQLDEILMKRRRAGDDDAFGEDGEPPANAGGGWMEVKEEHDDDKEQEMEEAEVQAQDEPEKEEVVSEVSVGKGLAGALQLLKERGTLKETVEWGGRNMDKKKSKLVGITDKEDKFRNREIILDRVDEFGRTMTPKEAFRKLSHKFHGKGPGKMKQEKKMKQYEEEMKLKQMSAGDTPLLSMEKMREAQAKMHTPYIVISGHIKPGQTSDPRSGFATVEKASIGSLTPMLGDKKVEHFLGIKRKPEAGNMKPPLPKKPKQDAE
jgi:U4/U6.U5 tri-snRNP-associated protein 1